MEPRHRRLLDEEVAWLTTVDAGGHPQSSPVWFLWHDGTVHIASQPSAGKVANVAAHPLVALHLEGAGPGDLVVTMEATAAVDDDGFGLDVAGRYGDKYAGALDDLGTSAEAYLSNFSVAVQLTPTRWRVFTSQ